METDSNNFKNFIFDLMNGEIDLDTCSCKESKLVENEFAEGTVCGKANEEIYTAKYRLCEKLCTEEDNDLECIFANFSIITRELCIKMYDYRHSFYQNSDKNIQKMIILYNNVPDYKKERFIKFIETLNRLMKNDETNRN